MNPEEVLRDYEQCRNQADILQQNLNLIDSNLGELMIVKKSLDEIKEMATALPCPGPAA